MLKYNLIPLQGSIDYELAVCNVLVWRFAVRKGLGFILDQALYMKMQRKDSHEVKWLRYLHRSVVSGDNVVKNSDVSPRSFRWSG